MPIDYRSYPSNWKTQIVPAIRKRSNDCCEECGLPNLARVVSIPYKRYRKGKQKTFRVWYRELSYLDQPGAKLVTVILTVAHLDHDAHNRKVDLSRLKHLCQRCHLVYDAARKARKKKCKVFCTIASCYYPACVSQRYQITEKEEFPEFGHPGMTEGDTGFGKD
jgi:hypothetical protein